MPQELPHSEQLLAAPPAAPTPQGQPGGSAPLAASPQHLQQQLVAAIEAQLRDLRQQQLAAPLAAPTPQGQPRGSAPPAAWPQHRQLRSLLLQLLAAPPIASTPQGAPGSFAPPTALPPHLRQQLAALEARLRFLLQQPAPGVAPTPQGQPGGPAPPTASPLCQLLAALQELLRYHAPLPAVEQAVSRQPWPKGHRGARGGKAKRGLRGGKKNK